MGVLIRTWISGLASFLAVTTAFCVALVVAITGPPSWGELRGLGDSVGAAVDQISAFANRQIEAYNEARTRSDAPPVRIEEVRIEEEAPPPAPPRMIAEAPRMDEARSPPSADADDLAGGLNESSPRITRAPRAPPQSAPPIMRAEPPALRAAPMPERTPRAARPQPPRTLASPPPAPPAQTVEIAPPVEQAVERPSLTDQLMQAVEALIPTMEVSEEAPKPSVKDAEPLPDPYADTPYEPAPPEAGNPAHEEARQRARGWSPQPGDRFPVDERDLERWSRN